MNKQPIESARDPDIRLALQALQRAALRARELAARTGTAIVVSCDGVLEYITPQTEPTAQRALEPEARYGDEA